VLGDRVIPPQPCFPGATCTCRESSDFGPSRSDVPDCKHGTRSRAIRRALFRGSNPRQRARALFVACEDVLLESNQQSGVFLMPLHGGRHDARGAFEAADASRVGSQIQPVHQTCLGIGPRRASEAEYRRASKPGDESSNRRHANEQIVGLPSSVDVGRRDTKEPRGVDD
jgi:hypothetical protein